MESSDQNNYEFPLKKEHERILIENGLDLERIVALRRNIHQYPEIAFKEFETSRKIKEILVSFGIEEENIRHTAITGLVVDINGRGPQVDHEDGKVNTIALRTDIDALPIPENNPHLEYKSQTNCAHMCGHDGHIATLMAAAQVFAHNRDKIPQNKTIRLLIQPAEESQIGSSGGAKPMIEEGCLEHVDEVYGFHNIPNFREGDIRVKEGPIMAASTIFECIVSGIGGHGSSPHLCNDVITAAASVVNSLHTIKSRAIDSKENFIFSISKF